MCSFCCTSKRRLLYHYRCPECQDQLPGEAAVFELIETVSSTDSYYSYLGFKDVISSYWTDCPNLSLEKKKKDVHWHPEGHLPNNIKAKRESMEAGNWVNHINRHSPCNPFNTGRPLSMRFLAWTTSIMTRWLERAGQRTLLANIKYNCHNIKQILALEFGFFSLL